MPLILILVLKYLLVFECFPCMFIDVEEMFYGQKLRVTDCTQYMIKKPNFFVVSPVRWGCRIRQMQFKF